MPANAGEEAPLAAIVPKPEADRAIAALRGEGVYDDDRRVTPHDGEHLAIPVERRPTRTSVREVTVQEDPEPRIRGLADRLRARGWAASDVRRAPSSWAVIGKIVTARFDDCPRPAVVSEELLALHGEAHTVLDVRGVRGELREPDVSVVAGTGETETVHREHGTAYGMDLSVVMFAPGNEAERVRMGEAVSPGETVFDMFAGIGYFTLPMARAGADVVAAERNPVAFEYLRENLGRNGVSDRVDPRLVDCRELCPPADRVVMGYYEATSFLPTALAAVRPGGVVHLHGTVPREDRWDALEAPVADACHRAGRRWSLEDRRVVKSHNPGLDHVVLDVRIDP